MDKVLHGPTFKICLCYLDDILIASETFDEHIEDINNVFKRLRDAGLKLGPKKCTFARDSCICLGHLISKNGVQPPPDRIAAIQNCPAPQSVRELRRVIGLFNWFKKYIENFSSTIEPLTRLLRKNDRFRWTTEQETAFQKLKSLLVSSPILAFPKYNIPFYLAVDTSPKGIGYVLYQYQKDDNDIEIRRVIRYG